MTKENPDNCVVFTKEEAEMLIEEFHQKHPRSKKAFEIVTMYHIREIGRKEAKHD